LPTYERIEIPVHELSGLPRKSPCCTVGKACRRDSSARESFPELFHLVLAHLPSRRSEFVYDIRIISEFLTWRCPCPFFLGLSRPCCTGPVRARQPVRRRCGTEFRRWWLLGPWRIRSRWSLNISYALEIASQALTGVGLLDGFPRDRVGLLTSAGSPVWTSATWCVKSRIASLGLRRAGLDALGSALAFSF